ncbi:MAG: hypothetical protein Q7S02_01410 [bacterium]|nr:hypothetical protein [bacterium]
MNKTKPKTQPKKPPAHEVILARLKELEQWMDEIQGEIQGDGKPKQRDYMRTATLRAHLALIGAIFNDLICVLATMHLPEKELPKIYHAIVRINGASIFPDIDERIPWDDLCRMLEEQLGPEAASAISMTP